MLDRSKYVVVMGYHGLEQAYIISCIDNHSDVLKMVNGDKSRVLGAGTLQIYVTEDKKIGICCYGESCSLGIKSRNIVDSKAVARTLFSEMDEREEQVKVF